VDVGGRACGRCGERGVEIGNRGKTEGALAKGAGGEDFGGEEGLGGSGFRAAVKEEEGIAGADLAGGADEGAPEIFGGVSGGGFGLGFNLGFNLFGEEDFDEAGGLGEFCCVCAPERVAKRRVGRTRESFRMSRSPGWRSCGRLAKRPSVRTPVARLSTNMRLDPRWRVGAGR